jgi:hypothetical protein
MLHHSARANLGAGPDEGAMPLYVKDCADKWVLTSVADDLSGGF